MYYGFNQGFALNFTLLFHSLFVWLKSQPSSTLYGSEFVLRWLQRSALKYSEFTKISSFALNDWKASFTAWRSMRIFFLDWQIASFKKSKRNELLVITFDRIYFNSTVFFENVGRINAFCECHYFKSYELFCIKFRFVASATDLTMIFTMIHWKHNEF